jgi:hypothetical protein
LCTTAGSSTGLRTEGAKVASSCPLYWKAEEHSTCCLRSAAHAAWSRLRPTCD